MGDKTITEEFTADCLISNQVNAKLLEEVKTVEDGLYAQNVEDILSLTGLQEKCVAEGINSG